MIEHRIVGFTLIELLIALAIAALLAVLAMPNYSVWVADNQIRNAADSIVGGLRAAQAEAIKRNEQVEFVLDPTTGTGGWVVQVVSAPVPPVQQGYFAEGASSTQIPLRVPAAATTVAFNGLGFIVANADASPTLTEVDITSTTALVGTRNLNVLIGGGRTGIKVCDPKWPATDPKGCPT